MRQGLSIHDMDASERPREKLLHRGAKELTTAELLAIILRTGTPEMNVIEMSQRLLSHNNGSLYTLYKDLQMNHTNRLIKGLGKTKSVTLMAAMELGIRLVQDQRKVTEERVSISRSREVYDYMYSSLFGLNEEELWLLMINNAGHITSAHRISKGGLSETTADIKVILKTALKQSSGAIILVHNHPSGNTTPSQKDDQLTERLSAACRLIDIKLLDHIIFGDGEYFSYLDHNRLL